MMMAIGLCDGARKKSAAESMPGGSRRSPGGVDRGAALDAMNRCCLGRSLDDGRLFVWGALWRSDPCNGPWRQLRGVLAESRITCRG